VSEKDESESAHRHLVWHEHGRRKLYSFGIFDLFLTDRSTDDGSRGEFVLLGIPHWVTIVPVVREGNEEKFLMVRQFRHGSGKVTLEFPAGTVEPGEDPAVTAERELLEETGYRAERLACAGRVNPNPAFMNNYTHTFVASGLSLVSAQNLDQFENVEVEAVPVRTVIQGMGTDPYGNGVMIIALWSYQRWRAEHPEFFD